MAQRRLARPGLQLIAVFVLLAGATSLAGLAIKALAPSFDLEAVRWLTTHRSPALIRIASMVTALGSLVWLAPAVVVVAIAIIVRWRRRRQAIGLGIVTAGAALLAVITKSIVGRPRPPVERLAHVSSTSFPSEHAVQAAAIYLALALLLGAGCSPVWRRLLVAVAIGLAVVVAASRVYLGVHYPTDVAGGLLLGWVWGWFAWRVVVDSGQ
jgi:undecaprenyl-diphosphatase